MSGSNHRSPRVEPEDDGWDSAETAAYYRAQRERGPNPCVCGRQAQ
jgi:hypothetical protein